MNNQPHVSTISGTAPPSYMETIGQYPPSKNNVPAPPFMPQPQSYVEQPSTGYYPTISTNYQERSMPQPPRNPTFVPTAANVPTYSTAAPENVNVIIVKHRRSTLCCYVFKWILFFIILSVVVALAKVIIKAARRVN